MSDDPSPTPRESRLLSWIPFDHGCPLIIARIGRRTIAFMFILPFVMNITLLMFSFNPVELGHIVAMGIAFAPMVAPVLVAGFYSIPIRRAVRQCRGHVCVNCLYDLRGQPDDGQCPECGQRYLMLTVLAQWKKAYPRLFKGPSA